MKTNMFFIAALSITTLLASCVKETRLPDGEDLTVRIAIKQEGVGSRAAGAPVSDKAAVQFNDGLLLFANENNKVTKVVRVVDDGFAFANDKVGKGALEAGTVITGVPSISTQAYFIGNPPQGIKNEAVVGADFNWFTDIEEQTSPTGGVENVTLFGGGQLDPNDKTGEMINYTASFKVIPIVTRLEIGSITGKHSSGDASKLTYKLTGIFINKYYYRMAVYGYPREPEVDNGTIGDFYLLNGPNRNYTSNGVMFDYNAAGLSLDVGKVWAYNLLAPKSGTANSAMPSIVLRLEDVTVNGTALSAPQFVTFSTFKKSDDTLIKELEQGKIWDLGNISFNENDISPAPYVKSKSVEVKVTIMAWEKYPVKVEY